MLEEILWVAIGLTVVYLLKKYFEPAPPPRKYTPPPPIVERAYTLEEVRKSNGKDNSPILIAIRGKVYDVSRGRQSYGPGGPYNVFAGHDATVALAKGSLDPADLNKDDSSLNATEISTLNDWISMYETKYDRVGWLETGVGEKGTKQQ